uniref:Uncharacterized protein n=1 Tax=Anguilla anguilla TaxID=7936 RepID=A0A0E9RAU0_ANGAN
MHLFIFSIILWKCKISFLKTRQFLVQIKVKARVFSAQTTCREMICAVPVSN